MKSLRFVGFLRPNWKHLLVILSLTVLAVLFLLYNSSLFGILGRISGSNELLVQEIGAQNVVIAQLNQENAELENTIVQVGELFQQMTHANDIIWCTDMPLENLSEVLEEVTPFVLNFVAQRLAEVQPSRLCMDLLSTFGSPQTGEFYFSVLREFPGGARDRLIVYLEPVPGQPEDLRVAGFYDVITREFIPITYAPQPEERAQDGE